VRETKLWRCFSARVWSGQVGSSEEYWKALVHLWSKGERDDELERVQVALHTNTHVCVLAGGFFVEAVRDNDNRRVHVQMKASAMRVP